MSDVQKLLDEDAVAAALYGDRCIQPPQTDHARHVMDALRLPDYKAAVEALERLADAASVEEEDWSPQTHDELVAALNQAGSALARLRETVPSNV